MTFGFSESVGATATCRQRWKDLEFYVSDSWKVSPRVTVDIGVRCVAVLSTPTPTDDTITSFDPALFDPALGSDPCNGLLHGAGHEPVPGGRVPGRNRRAQPLALGRDKRPLRAAPRASPGTSSATARRRSARASGSSSCASASARPGPRQQPAVRQRRTGIRKLDTHAEPCDGCFGVSSRRRPRSGREVKALIPNNWQWNLVARARDRAQHEARARVRRQQGHAPAPVLRRQPGAPATPTATASPTAWSTCAPAATAARSAAAALRRLRRRQHHHLGPRRQLDLPLAADPARQPLRPRLAVPGLLHLVQVDRQHPLDNSDGIAATTASPTSDNPALDRGLSLDQSRRTSSTPAWSCVLPTLEDKSGFVKHVFGDWEIGAIVAAASGTPLTVYNGRRARAERRASRARATPTTSGRTGCPASPAAERRPAGADPEPARLHARPASSSAHRQRRTRHLHGPGLLPGGPVALQEHPAQQPASRPSSASRCSTSSTGPTS